jgi:heterodisulfide reductase subunit C/large-conductance mechanosensitive channel
MGITNIIFIIIVAAAAFLFTKNVRRIARNINLGKDVDLSDNKPLRWKTMARVALGQSKMTTRPVAGFLHILVYVGFVIINIEVLEIFIDGIFGTHRVFSSFLGSFYNVLIGSFEVLAFLVLASCVIFFIRRNVLKIKRFHYKEMTSWPKTDANLILITEIALMWAFLSMNSADHILQLRGAEHYIQAGAFPISSLLDPIFSGMSDGALIAYERGAWWFHIVGILAFLNYIPYSKHFHIFLAFPNTYYSNLKPKGQFNNMDSVTAEVKLMMDPEADPYAAAPADAEPPSFGAKDVNDLTWKNLMDAYSCTECGRCSSVCPATQTGKLLSPRKIMMDTRDRVEELGKHIDKNGKDTTDNKSLLGDYILDEELWACTSCNACTDACPINIDPLNIIIELRRNLVMESSQMPSEIATMTTNIQNNGAPWAFGQADRANWINED